MPVLIKILFLTTALWSSVYSVSYAVCQLKNRRLLPAIAATLLTLLMLIIGALSIFRI